MIEKYDLYVVSKLSLDNKNYDEIIFEKIKGAKKLFKIYKENCKIENNSNGCKIYGITEDEDFITLYAFKK